MRIEEGEGREGENLLLYRCVLTLEEGWLLYLPCIIIIFIFGV